MGAVCCYDLKCAACLLLAVLVLGCPQCELTPPSPGRRSVIEISRALKELFHEARERASKALGFAKMLRKVSPPAWLLLPCSCFVLKADPKEASLL